MSSCRRKQNINTFMNKVEEMEKLNHQYRDYPDWEDDATNPLEKSMTSKERRVTSRRGFHNDYNQRRGSIDEMSSASSGNCESFRSSSPSQRSSSPRRGGSPRRNYPRYRGGRYNSNRGSFEMRSQSLEPRGSCSSNDPQPQWDLTAPNLAKCLAEFDRFQATLLQLRNRFQYDHVHMERIASRNNYSFEVEGEIIKLRPAVRICSSHLSREGCENLKSCTEIHICLKYAMGNCKVQECLYGHVWHTNHNKPILYKYNLNFLPIRKLFELFKTIILPEKFNGELQICKNYNANRCMNDDCSQLHLCILFLAKLCNESECNLSHDVLDKKASCILQMHGVSLNEAPRDLVINITRFPLIQKRIKLLILASKSVMEENTNTKDKDERKEREEEEDKDIEIQNIITVNQEKKIKNDVKDVLKEKIEIEPEEKIPFSKTVWSHDLFGGVKVDEICYDSVEGFCSYEESGCWRLHCPYHFHWQIKATLGKKISWMNLAEEQVQTLERAYCDPSISKINLPVLDSLNFRSSEKGLLLILKGKSKWEADFKQMELILSDKNEVLKLRRLCTENTENETPLPCIWKWYFSDKSHKWIEYGNVDSTGVEKLKCNVNSEIIEDSFQRQIRKSLESTLSFNNDCFSYTLDFNNMIQTNLQTGVSRRIRRRPTPHIKKKNQDSVIDLPSKWDSMQPEERFIKITIAPSSEEYKVISNYVHTLGPENVYNILKIERVQNPYLWRAFQNKVQQMKMIYKNDATVGIRQLFHGTGSDIVPKICEENFDWRLHGTSAGQAYGRGTYFSTSSSYSYKFARPDQNGHRFMFVAKVAIGTITSGNPSMARPPINQQYDLPYDSTVDQVSLPKIIVKYDKQEYYPEYIITFG